MSTSEDTSSAPDLASVRERFEAWRSGRPPGGRIPNELWDLAIALLAVHSAPEVARQLGLHPERLRRRHADIKRRDQPTRPATPRRGSTTPAPTFLELTPDVLTHARRTGSEVRLVVERADGLRLSLLAGDGTWPRLEALVRSLLAE